MTKSFTERKLEEFDNKFVVYDEDDFPTISVASRVKGIKAFLSESIGQAKQEGIKETAISMDKKGKEWLESNATEAIDLLEGIREQAREEERKRIIELIRKELRFYLYYEDKTANQTMREIIEKIESNNQDK